MEDVVRCSSVSLDERKRKKEKEKGNGGSKKRTILIVDKFLSEHLF